MFLGTRHRKPDFITFNAQPAISQYANSIKKENLMHAAKRQMFWEKKYLEESQKL